AISPAASLPLFSIPGRAGSCRMQRDCSASATSMRRCGGFLSSRRTTSGNAAQRALWPRPISMPKRGSDGLLEGLCAEDGSGTPPTQVDQMIRGYRNPPSVLQGESVRLHIASDTPLHFQIWFYRQGQTLVLKARTEAMVADALPLGAPDRDWNWPI